MTFSLNTYPDIFPDLRHPVVRFAAALDTHGDFRVDNMFFGADDKDHDEFAVVDWQASGLGSGLYDVAYFMGSSVPTEIRRQMEHEALEEYYRVVLDLGAQEFSLADCWQLYRKNMLAILFVAVIAGG